MISRGPFQPLPPICESYLINFDLISGFGKKMDQTAVLDWKENKRPAHVFVVWFSFKPYDTVPIHFYIYTVNKDTEPKDPYPIARKIMAEPDYIDDDNPELIRPQKLINPVKSSRNHQDLHRELLMNQKRGLAPQNKPELQKVMEKRKRDQVIKQQKEEEAQKKKSDLEIELLKRQQKLEQLELEQQKIQEEQENAPEFVKVKGNLRRTVQEATEAPDS
ncbi:protein FAM107B [Grus japonensis]|uniref:Protein FAM107B n=1 Tax=Grus japonensis TaxID=30415 RepID=A0ABC9VSE6_GRUJA